MKKILAVIILITLSVSLISCDAVYALKYSISGDIIDPVEGFSRGEEERTLIYKDNKYILLEEISGDCGIHLSDSDIMLGQQSNWPFFPNHAYYVNSGENPSFIMGGPASGSTATYVYIREDIYNGGIIYTVEDSRVEFDFAYDFIKTDKVNYDDHIKTESYAKNLKIHFYVKDIPIITVKKSIYLIDGVWYSVDIGDAYQLSDEFVDELIKEGIID